MHLIWFLLVGLVAGWLAGKLTKGSGFGVVGDVAIGVIGAFVGGFLFRLVGISAGGTIGSIIVATVGAVVLVVVVKALKKA
ncbi:MAG TPA: GlsB/YeaQ/YmgE family stress response membrane protein [Vicinamibacteria bacterium]|nr:GlsB/YeaQ/YmgE family stress response membrane protein [Vicinamibacteria bacterium]